MATVLHLIDSDAGFAAKYLSAALAHGPEAAESDVAQVGPGSAHRDVWACARWLKRHARNVLIHAWGTRSVIAAGMADVGPIVYTPQWPLDYEGFTWLNRVRARRRVDVVCDSVAARSALCLRGLPLDECHVIVPGAKVQAITPDGEMRKRLLLEEGDFAVLAPGESLRGAGHDLSLWTLAILHELSQSWKLLIWGRGALAEEIWTMAEQLNCTGLLHFDETAEFEQILSAADTAIVTGEAGSCALPRVLCMGAGMGIAATAAEGLADRRNALVAAERSPRTLAQNLIELRTNQKLRESLGAAARRDAEKSYGIEKFGRAHRALYDRVLIRRGSSLPVHGSR